MRPFVPIVTLIFVFLTWFAGQLVIESSSQVQDILTTDYFLSAKVASPIPLPNEPIEFPVKSWNTQDGRYEVYLFSDDYNIIFIPKKINNCKYCTCKSWK